MNEDYKEILKELKDYITELKCEKFYDEEFRYLDDVEVMEDINYKAFIGNHLMLIEKNGGKCSKFFIVRGYMDFLRNALKRWEERNKGR